MIGPDGQWGWRYIVYGTLCRSWSDVRRASLGSHTKVPDGEKLRGTRIIDLRSSYFLIFYRYCLPRRLWATPWNSQNYHFALGFSIALESGVLVVIKWWVATMYHVSCSKWKDENHVVQWYGMVQKSSCIWDKSHNTWEVPGGNGGGVARLKRELGVWISTRWQMQKTRPTSLFSLFLKEVKTFDH